MSISNKLTSPERNFSDAGIAMLITTIHFILVYLLFGFHYAWIEDVWMNLMVRGMATAEPIGNVTLLQQGFSVLFVELYRKYPEVPWYGITHYTILWCCMSAIILALIKATRMNRRALVASIAVMILLFTDILIAFSYWDTALLIGISAIALFTSFHKRGLTGYIVLLILCLAGAILMRLESIYFILLAFLLILGYQKATEHHLFQWRNLLLVPVLMALVYIAVQFSLKPFVAEKPPIVEQLKKQVVYFYDYGYQRPDFQLNSRQDSLSMLATISFFQAESKLNNDDFFNRLTYEGLFPAMANAHWKTRIVNAAVKSEQYNPDYLDYRNYGYKTLLVYAWGILFILLSFPPRRKWLIAGIFTLSMAMLVLIAIILKMEHHIHRSLLVMVILPLLLAWLNNHLLSSQQNRAMVIMVLFGIALAPRWLQSIQHFDKLYEEKVRIREVLLTLPEDYVFIDNFTSGFFFDLPLKDLPKDFSGKQLLFFPEQPIFFAKGALPVDQSNYEGLSPMEQYFKFLDENEGNVACLYVEDYRAELINAIGTEFYGQSPELTKTIAPIPVTSIFSDRQIPVNVYKPMHTKVSPSAEDK